MGITPGVGRQPADRPPSPLAYVFISAAGLALAVGLLFAYVYLAPRLIAANFQSQFYYIVLVIAGLVAAAFLVGGMRSYDAHVTYKRFGVAVQAGGAVAVFLMVVVLGLYGVPKWDATFNLTIRPVGAKQESLKTGKLTIQYGDKTDSENVGSNGEANFKQIPQRYWGQNLKITPEIEGFEKTSQYLTVNSVALDLAIPTEKYDTRLFGTVVPTPRKGQVVKVLVEGEDTEAIPDEFGRFSMRVHKKEGSTIRVAVYTNGKQVYDDFETLSGPVTLATRSPP